MVTKGFVNVTSRPSGPDTRPSATDEGLVMVTKGFVNVTSRPSGPDTRPSATDEGLVMVTNRLSI
jgi:hypothetical protein